MYAHDGKHTVRTVTDGIHGPDALAVDSQGTIYIGNIVNGGGGFVKVYPPGATSPATTIEATGTQALAIDSNDNLYVTTQNHINVYGNQGTSLLRTLTGTKRPASVGDRREGHCVRGLLRRWRERVRSGRYQEDPDAVDRRSDFFGRGFFGRTVRCDELQRERFDR